MAHTVTAPCPSGLGNHRGVYVWKKDGWPIYRCSTCQHMWLFPLPTDQELRVFYDQGYFQGNATKRGYVNYDQDKESMKKDFISYLAGIERLVSLGWLVDVGAATGFFCRLALERGWRVTGIELSAYAARVGQERGLDMREGTFEQHSSMLHGVNAITAWDVVEHLPDPFAFRKILPIW